MKTEIEKMFIADSKDKKVIGRSASKKVTHSGCRFEHRSQKQLNALTGPLVQFDLTLPIAWKQFTNLDTAIMREYLIRLAHEYHVDETNLPELLGAKWRAVSAVLSARGILGVMSNELKEMGPDGKVAKEDDWKTFCESLWSNPNAMEIEQPIVKSIDIFGDASAYLKSFRKEYHLTQKALAQAIGVNSVYISKVECKSATANLCSNVLSATKKYEATLKAASADAEINATKPDFHNAVVETAPDGAIGITIATARESLPQIAFASKEDLTLSGPVSAVLSAIEKIFGASQRISISVVEEKN